MKIKGLLAAFFALMFMVSAMFFSITAYAADDTDGENGGRTQPDLQFEPTRPTAPGRPPVPVELPPSPESESAIPEGMGLRPFTPNGTGTVVDNTTDGDGKEFYTIESEAGNIFYLIIDRQRNSQNVYFLNAVTEFDLIALALEGDGSSGTSVSAIPVKPTEPCTPDDSQKTPAEKQPEKSGESEPESESGGINNTIIFVGIGAAVVGGAGYYFKIIRPKKKFKDSDDGDYEDDVPDYDDYDNNPDDFGDENEIEGGGGE
jgi:hypothetical protein